MKNYCLITGCCGFIGYHLTKKMINDGYNVIGIDNINNYYDINLKEARLKRNLNSKFFIFYKIDITNKIEITKIFERYNFKIVLHFAAQAGVQFSLINPSEYVNNNIVGFFNIIELSKKFKILKIIYASSSSVYGNNDIYPFLEKHKVNKPKSIYAATKVSNELMAYTYFDLYGLSMIGLRLFTVYGPWGRPDMSYYIFVKSIIENKKFTLFNKGKQYRSFTYIDDVINSIIFLIEKLLDNDKPIYKIFNVGSSTSISIKKYVNFIERILGKSANISFEKSIQGDMLKTESDSSLLYDYIGFKPNIKLEVGLKKYIRWYKEYYNNEIY